MYIVRHASDERTLAAAHACACLIAISEHDTVPYEPQLESPLFSSCILLYYGSGRRYGCVFHVCESAPGCDATKYGQNKRTKNPTLHDVPQNACDRLQRYQKTLASIQRTHVHTDVSQMPERIFTNARTQPRHEL